MSDDSKEEFIRKDSSSWTASRHVLNSWTATGQVLAKPGEPLDRPGQVRIGPTWDILTNVIHFGLEPTFVAKKIECCFILFGEAQ